MGRLSADIAPFCSVAGMSFSAGAADAAGGGWRNYFIGLVGSVAADEDDILWPNQVTALFECFRRYGQDSVRQILCGPRCSQRCLSVFGGLGGLQIETDV